MSRFPQFRLRLPRASQPGISQRLRGVLSLVLVSFLFLAGLNLIVSGQEAPSNKTSKGEHFIIYTNASGEVVCREATRFEKEQLERINPQGLRQINHLDPDFKSSSDSQTGENVLPAHLTIILRATTQLNNNAAAKAAFVKAAQTWENAIKSPVTIYLDVDFGPTNFGQAWDPGTIGATSTPTSTYLYQSVRTNLIAGASNGAETPLYNSLPSSALPTNKGAASSLVVSHSIARAVGLIVPTADPGDAAARIGFNSNFAYDFDPSNGIGANQTDFEAVATHEIGHALGFISRAGRTEPANPAMWDVFRFRTGTTLGTFGSAQRIMTADGLQFYFSGPAERGLSTGGADGQAPGGDGQQSSHWRDDQISGVYIGIMDPTISAGIRRQITSNDTIALNAFGYNLENNNPPPPPPPPPPAPANNNFANAQTIAGCSGSVTGTNIGANKEAGEPSHDPAGDAGGGSIWYHWRAPSTGSVTITTNGSNFDTLLAVYTGSSLNALTEIAKNDDVDLGVIVSSTVTFNATANTVYRIAVDGWGGDAGNTVLNWTQSSCTQPNTLQLGATGYLVKEGNGSVQVIINRTNKAGAASVNYATSDTAGLNECDFENGVASSRCDYATSIGTLSFAANEGSKSLFIPLVNDSYAEPNETFSITLSNPVGVSLGAISTANITIQDNETVNGANPIAGTDFFVEQHYIDFLGRNPEPAGLQGWRNVLNNCPPSGKDAQGNFCDRIEVSAGFFRSPEFQARGYFIYRFFSSVGKIPIYPEFTPDFAKVSGFLSDAQLEANKAAFVTEFMARPVFQTKYSSTFNNPTAYVDALLTTVGLPTHPSRQSWINTLTATNNATTRGNVLRALVESSQVYDKYYNEAFVIMQYFGYLRRTADGSYVQWIDTMNQTNGDYRIMINGFLNSVEYRKRFGP